MVTTSEHSPSKDLDRSPIPKNFLFQRIPIIEIWKRKLEQGSIENILIGNKNQVELQPQQDTALWNSSILPVAVSVKHQQNVSCGSYK